MSIEEKIKVMQAYADGKQIQFLPQQYLSREWRDTKDPCWNWESYEYRIKPESKLRPYENAEEFLKAQKEHGMYLKTKNADIYYFPEKVNSDGITVLKVEESYIYCLNYFEWQDGHPMGILEE